MGVKPAYFPVLPRVPVVRYHCADLVCAGAAHRRDQQQQLHQIVVHLEHTVERPIRSPKSLWPALRKRVAKKFPALAARHEVVELSQSDIFAAEQQTNVARSTDSTSARLEGRIYLRVCTQVG